MLVRQYLLIWGIIFFGLAFGSQAQILNIKSSEAIQDSTIRSYLNVSLSGRLYNRTADADRPINFLGANGNLEWAYFSKRHRYTFLNRLDYLKINENPFNSTAFTHLRLNFMRLQRVSYLVFGQAQYDLLRLLDRRFLVGGGLRVRLLDTEQTHLFANFGYMYEHERWNNPKEDDAKVAANFIKSANYIGIRSTLNDHLSLNGILYYQVGRDRQAALWRHRLNFESSFLLKMTDALSWKIDLVWAYENAPIVPITRFIYSIANGIQVNIRQKK
ncbi:MAG: DUF481 domain-containing protein [Bernardetiaceae bacterium]